MHDAGQRLILEFYRGSRISGRGAVIFLRMRRNLAIVARIIRSEPYGGPATAFQRVSVRPNRLRLPTPAECSDWERSWPEIATHIEARRW